VGACSRCPTKAITAERSDCLPSLLQTGYGREMRVYSFVFVVMCSFAFIAAGCGTDAVACEVVDACASACTEACAPELPLVIACRGDACNCMCDTSGSGGNGGAGGLSGSGGAAGAGGEASSP
jgi:uncharacterized membrane protein YgcG